MGSSNRASKTGNPSRVVDMRRTAPPPGERDEMVRTAAYFIYENNGCRPDHALDDWVAAEVQLGLRSTEEEVHPPTEARQAH